MIAVELVWRVRDAGADLRLHGVAGVELLRPTLVDAETVEQLRAKRDEIRAFLASAQADAIVHAYALRRGSFLRAPAPCPYHIGYAHDGCRRCGASIAKHYER